MSERYENLDFAELWIRDGLRLCRPPGGFGSLVVDMTRSLAIVENFKRAGIRINCNHVIFRAVAVTLSRHPEVHKMGAGSKVLFPGTVDLGISVAGESFVSPVMVLRDAANKDLATIGKESVKLMRKAKMDDRKLHALLRRWGWLLPFAWLRTVILRFLFNRIWFRRGGVGTFQISCLPGLDFVCPFLFNTAAILGVGGIAERVIVVEGTPVVRPTANLSCTFNHEVWDGRAGLVFLSELKSILESGELEAESPTYSVATGS